MPRRTLLARSSPPRPVRAAAAMVLMAACLISTAIGQTPAPLPSVRGPLVQWASNGHPIAPSPPENRPATIAESPAPLAAADALPLEENGPVKASFTPPDDSWVTPAAVEMAAPPSRPGPPALAREEAAFRARSPAAAPPNNQRAAAPPAGAAGPEDQGAEATNSPATTLPREPAPSLPTLTPPEGTRDENGNLTAPSSGGFGAATTVVSSLAIVLGLFFAMIWVLKRNTPAGQQTLPGEVMQVLGRTPLGTRQHFQLLRIGNKLVLILVTPDGAETITEIEDPDEVNRLAGLCERTQPGSSTTAFQQILQQFTRQPAEPGFFGSSPSGENERSTQRAAASLRRLGTPSPYDT